MDFKRNKKRRKKNLHTNKKCRNNSQAFPFPSLPAHLQTFLSLPYTCSSRIKAQPLRSGKIGHVPLGIRNLRNPYSVWQMNNCSSRVYTYTIAVFESLRAVKQDTERSGRVHRREGKTTRRRRGYQTGAGNPTIMEGAGTSYLSRMKKNEKMSNSSRRLYF